MRATKYTVREWKLYDFAYTNYLKNLFDGDSSLDFSFLLKKFLLSQTALANFGSLLFFLPWIIKKKNEYRNTKRVLPSGDAI